MDMHMDVDTDTDMDTDMNTDTDMDTDMGMQMLHVCELFLSTSGCAARTSAREGT